MRFKLTTTIIGLALASTGCPEKKIVKPTKTVEVVRVIHPEEYCNQGVDALKARDEDKALGLFKKAIAKNEKRSEPARLADAHYNVGAILLSRGDLDGAELAFKIVLKKDPEHRDALLNLGVVLKEQKKYAKAIEHYREALKTLPREPEIMNNLIVVYRLNKQYKEAEKTGYKLLARASNNVEAYKNMTLIYYDQGKYEMAELLCINAGKMLEKRREKDSSVPEDAGIYNNMGMIYMGMKRYRDALAQFDRALKVDPNSIDALINLGAMAHRFRDYGRALAAYEKVLSLQPDHPLALIGRAYAVFGMGDAKKTIELFNKVLAGRPSDTDILFKMGEIYNKQLRDYAKALSYYQKYKRTMGRNLKKDDPVHNKIQTTRAKLEMTEQLRKEQQEEDRRHKVEEEKKRKALEEAKKAEAAGKKEGQKKLDDLIKVDESAPPEGEAPEGKGEAPKPEEEKAAPGEADKPKPDEKEPVEKKP